MSAPEWSMAHWSDAVDRPEIVDEALDRRDRHAGVALLVLVLDHPDPAVSLPRIKRGLRAADPQTRVNAVQSLGHHARLHRMIDTESIALLRRARRDRTMAGGYQIRGYAHHAASDVGMFAPRRDLPRWLRRRHPGPRRTPV